MSEEQVVDAEKKATKSAVTSPIDGLMPNLVQLLEAGVHFGHERSKRNPKMEPYIFMHRNRVAIFDLEQTQAELKKAALFAYNIARVPSNDVLFVGTKRQARSIVRTWAEEAHQPYVTKRWLGGTLTNFRTIQKSIEKLDELRSSLEDPVQQARFTKKEKSVRLKEIGRLEAVLEGIRSMRRLPAAVFVVGAHDEKIGMREAKRMNIPVIGVCDTNADPSWVQHIIPANDDAVRALELVVAVIGKAVMLGRANPIS